MSDQPYTPAEIEEQRTRLAFVRDVTGHMRADTSEPLAWTERARWLATLDALTLSPAAPSTREQEFLEAAWEHHRLYRAIRTTIRPRLSRNRGRVTKEENDEIRAMLEAHERAQAAYAALPPPASGTGGG